ncbi:uncharacterized protein MELLADRAFT_108136 [Melampsora larici-populina 98AG31]|uniref:Uncharacterized protein n=1 Tax=Melampsora larici-populina (strain 98AG31 / pathotype 3-4-7) TaxID=747676 RepID=F4RS30_MELLP|nr:uncharacterized protein MELLADRAFT_108136 [Melampsora larici-populina 98AG31]EGG04784.1 hypothetical protein MELLADRAFT_108136 [Melampsora larici-populina 98AG31]
MLMKPVRILPPRMSPKVLKLIEKARAEGQNLEAMDHLLDMLDFGEMTHYASLTTRLSCEGANYPDWIARLDQTIWTLANKRFYLQSPPSEITTLLDLVLDEVVLAMIHATVHCTVSHALGNMRGAHDAVMWIKWFYDINRSHKGCVFGENESLSLA